MMGWISLHRAAEIAGIDRKNARVKLLNIKKNHPAIHKKLVRKSGSYYELKEPEIVVFFQTDFRKFKIKPFLENLVSKSNNLKRVDKNIISKANELQSRSESGELGFDINEIIEQTTDPEGDLYFPILEIPQSSIQFLLSQHFWRWHYYQLFHYILLFAKSGKLVSHYNYSD